jgi:hypothetical protein
MVPPVETVLGQFFDSGRRIERSTVFPGANYRHDSACGSRRFKIELRDSQSGFILYLSGFKSANLPISFLKSQGEITVS